LLSSASSSVIDTAMVAEVCPATTATVPLLPVTPVMS